MTMPAPNRAPPTTNETTARSGARNLWSENEIRPEMTASLVPAMAVAIAIAQAPSAGPPLFFWPGKAAAQTESGTLRQRSESAADHQPENCRGQNWRQGFEPKCFEHVMTPSEVVCLAQAPVLPLVVEPVSASGRSGNERGGIGVSLFRESRRMTRKQLDRMYSIRPDSCHTV